MSAVPDHGRQHVCAFDFDGTLSSGDNVVPFLRRLASTPRLGASMLLRPHQLFPALVRRDRDRLKALATEPAFAGRQASHVDALAIAYASHVVATRLRSDVLARLRWHQQQHHLVLIVSASYEVYLRHIGDLMKLDGVLGTRLELIDDTYTGRLDGPNCRGGEKVARLDAWLASRSLSRADIVLWAYGDSAGDRQLLAAADHPVWVQEPLDSVVPSV